MKELSGSKAGCQILQIYKTKNVLHIFIYFGNFFKSMYLHHQMMATFMQIDTIVYRNTWLGNTVIIFIIKQIC